MEQTRPSTYKPQIYPKLVCISASHQASKFQGLLLFFGLIWIFIFPLSTLISSVSFISFFTEVILYIPSAPANWHASFEVRETVPIYTTADLFNIVLELQMGPSCKSCFASKLTPNQGVFGFVVVVQTPFYGCVITEREKCLSEQNGGPAPVRQAHLLQLICMNLESNFLEVFCIAGLPKKGRASQKE